MLIYQQLFRTSLLTVIKLNVFGKHVDERKAMRKFYFFGASLTATVFSVQTLG